MEGTVFTKHEFKVRTSQPINVSTVFSSKPIAFKLRCIVRVFFVY